METQLDNQSSKLDSIEKKLDKFIGSSDRKYASVNRVERVEKAVYGAIGVILTAVILAIVMSAAPYLPVL